MYLWQLLIIVGIFLLILEMFTPMMFFLSLSVASFITAGLSLYTQNLNYLVPFFAVLSVILVFFLRPLIMNGKNTKNKKTGIDEKYIGKTAKVSSTVNGKEGVISIYDERWEARSEDNSTITIGSEVKIIRNNGLVFFVEKI